MSRRSTTLSKNLLQMKFMHRTKEKTEKQLNEQRNDELLDQHFDDNDELESQKYIINTSYVYCEGLRSGRMSFRGMNPEVEKLMQEIDENDDKDKEDNDNNEKNTTQDVSDDEMANRYSKLMSDSASGHRKRNHKNFNRHHISNSKRFKPNR
ncbi:M-phase phosphoprotein 6-like [Oppia nitens]|uniref:M-phase phosphoprotein 6-like n=1 Tax=Oppia nitens TaxID=1686743 RepID=UPI0023DB4CC2|nr:M-phase phosphoprotein 6-like [Oppia nitens]